MADAETTAQLLGRIRAGDRNAVESLFRRYAAPLRRWAHGRLPQWARDVADTGDLVQEVLLQTLKQLETFDPRTEDALQAYLRQAVMNRVRDELRRHRRRPQAVALDSQAICHAPSPLEDAIGQEAMDRYQQGLMQLSASDRDAIIGRLELGLTYEELAEYQGKPSAEAARKGAQRALVRLVEAMKHVR
jgi:RNA polymerase sigma factor (sigma-70 family)